MENPEIGTNNQLIFDNILRVYVGQWAMFWKNVAGVIGYTHIHYRIIHDSQNMEVTMAAIIKRISEENVA